MRSKFFKVFCLSIITVAVILIGNKPVDAITNSKFKYDWELWVSLPDELHTGSNDIVLSERARTEKGLRLDNIKVSYKITEIDAKKYEEFKSYQDQIDAKIEKKEGLTGSDPAIQGFEKLVADGLYWCYDDYKVGKITLNSFCDGPKYFIVTADVEAVDENIKDSSGYKFEHMAARVYKVTGDTCKCENKDGKYFGKDGKQITKEQYDIDCAVPKCKIENNKYYGPNGEELSKEQFVKLCPSNNPKTGSTTPYVVCSILAGSAIAVIMIIKKKRFI